MFRSALVSEYRDLWYPDVNHFISMSRRRPDVELIF
jgi:hypothetical protein